MDTIFNQEEINALFGEQKENIKQGQQSHDAIIQVTKFFEEQYDGLKSKNGGRKPKILVVDDEPHIVNLIKLTLREKFDILEAYSGKEALKAVKSEQPDLITLDIMMPGLSGLTVCQKLKNDPETKTIPIILLTAKRQLKDKFDGMYVGADDYITKPFDTNDLIQSVYVNLGLVKEDMVNPEISM